MLLIRLNDGSYKEWVVGDKLTLSFNEFKHIAYIKADGKELDTITNCFHTTIPLKQAGREQTIYTGDIAKTIVANIGLYKD